MIYLDHAATTPLHPRVLETMLPYLTDYYGNASSLHQAGQKARRGVEHARDQVALALGASSKEIIFTSGATEADNQALRSVAQMYPKGHIITSSIEHAGVLSSCKYLEKQGHAVTYLNPNLAGEITVQSVLEAIRSDTVLIALMLINNETGVRTDITTISKLAHEKGILVFCDAVQAFGFEQLNIKELGVDLLSLSAHKIYGPKGVGALYIRSGLDLPAFMLGGEQERGFRAGTHNTAGIVGMGKAAELAIENIPRVEMLKTLRDDFEKQLLSLKGVNLNGTALRGPKHCNMRVSDVDGEALLLALDQAGICASAGSACAAGSLEPSHVLSAMGLSPQEAKASVRFSLGYHLTKDSLDKAVEHIDLAIQRCRLFA